MYLLFDSVAAAHEVSFMLRLQWDGCNGVMLTSGFDRAALGTAVDLLGTECCLEGSSLPVALGGCWQPDEEKDELNLLAQRVLHRAVEWMIARDDGAPF